MHRSAALLDKMHTVWPSAHPVIGHKQVECLIYQLPGTAGTTDTSTTYSAGTTYTTHATGITCITYTTSATGTAYTTLAISTTSVLHRYYIATTSLLHRYYIGTTVWARRFEMRCEKEENKWKPEVKLTLTFVILVDVDELRDAVISDVICVLLCLLPWERCPNRQKTHCIKAFTAKYLALSLSACCCQINVCKPCSPQGKRAQ